MQVDDEVLVWRVGIHADCGPRDPSGHSAKAGGHECSQRIELGVGHLATDRLWLGQLAAMVTGDLQRRAVERGHAIDADAIRLADENRKSFWREPIIALSFDLEPSHHLALDTQGKWDEIARPGAGGDHHGVECLAAL